MPQEKFEKFANEYTVSLFPGFMMPRGFYEESTKILGEQGPVMINLIENHNVKYFTKPSDWNRAHTLFVKKIENRPQLLVDIMEKMQELAEELVNECMQIPKNLENLSKQQLWRIYADFITKNTLLYGYGLLLPLLDYQTTTYLSNKVEAILKPKLQGEKFADYFATLTTPTKDTFNKKQELALLEIVDQVLKNDAAKNLFINNDAKEVLDQIATKAPTILQVIKQHTEEFDWVYYVYDGPALTEIDFVENIQDFLKKGIDPQAELENHDHEIEKLIARQTDIVEEICLTPEEKTTIELARETVFHKPWRRDMQSHCYRLLEPVFKAIAKYLGLDLAQVRMLLPDEIKKGLLESQKIEVNFPQRERICAYWEDENGEHVLDGNDAEKFVDENLYEHIEKVDTAVTELKGTVACVGSAQGCITIVNTPENMLNMKDGNILVSFATNPNLMPAIRKAAAIITDEGGLTCHAAIVSRELKIPCVVGTKIATKVLKDGDQVSVDANRGIVKIIKG